MPPYKLSFLPDRTEKPRDTGLTMVMDHGLSLAEMESLFDVHGSEIDLWKFPWAMAFVLNQGHIRKKVRLCLEAGIDTFVGGTFFEANHLRDQVDDFERWNAELGMTAIEISDGSVLMPREQKLEYIRRFAKGFKVIGEVGAKDSKVDMSPGEWVSCVQEELSAGAFKVIAEGRSAGVSGIFNPDGSIREDIVNRLLTEVGGQHIIWETPHKRHQDWFIHKEGANVNLGNIAPEQLIALRCMRLGLRGDTLFRFLPEEMHRFKK